MDKETLRTEFLSYSKKFCLVPHNSVGTVAFRDKTVDFQEAFHALANEFGDAKELDKAKKIIDEARALFDRAMVPHAERQVKNHAPNPQFWIALHFLKIQIEFTNDISVGPEKTDTQLSYEEMFDWHVGTSADYRQLQAPWTVADVREYLANFGGEYNWSKQKASLKQKSSAH